MASIQKLEVDIGDLLFDQENPRIGQVGSQSDALAAVVRLSGRNFKNMMRSIKEHGLDPGDSFYLVQEGAEDDPYVVVDGNRRLAALKVLSQPDLLQGTNLTEAAKRPLMKEAARASGGRRLMRRLILTMIWSRTLARCSAFSTATNSASRSVRVSLGSDATGVMSVRFWRRA